MSKIRMVTIFAIIAAFSGFLFGFDMVVISGADQTLQALWKSSNLFHGMVIMATALWGTVLGSIYGHLPTNKWGRKPTLLIVGILFALSALGSAFASDPYFFAFARFLGGIGIGASTIAAPAYISEIAPSNLRGRLVGLYQFFIVFGILCAYLSNYFFSQFGSESWRWMLGIQVIPALLFAVGILFIPESERWKHQKIDSPKMERITDQKYRRILWLTFFIAFFNQFSGINAFLYYAPRIFELANLNADSAALSSIGVGVVNLIFTMLGLLLIDKLGRKTLLRIGGIGYVVSLGLVALFLIDDSLFRVNLLQKETSNFFVSIFFFLFIASHAIGQGAVIWVFISEIFPDHLRAKGQAFGSATHWILAALIPAFMPWLFQNIGSTERLGAAYVFLFFMFMMVIQLFWINWHVPETKGKSLEELNNELLDK